MSNVQYNNYRPSYRLIRRGPEGIVFIHGLGSSKRVFEPCFEMKRFSGYTLAAIDLPGFGDGAAPAGFSFEMKDHAELALGWVDDIGLERIIVVGHSMGGVIGLRLCERLGTKAEAFFNLEGNLSSADCSILSGRITAFSREVFVGRGYGQFVRSLKDLVRKDPSPGLKNYLDDLSRASPDALYSSALSLVRESSEGRLLERFLGLQLPKCYVFGERSLRSIALFSCSTDSEERGDIVAFLEGHGVECLVVPASGHFMMEDQPGIFYKMLFEAIAKTKRA